VVDVGPDIRVGEYGIVSQKNPDNDSGSRLMDENERGKVKVPDESC